MKKTAFTLILLVSFLAAQSQISEKEKYALITSVSSIGAGPVQLTDPYLSPFEYSGFGLQFQNQTRRFFNPNNRKLSSSQHFLLDIGDVNHPAGNNSMYFFNMNYSYGVNYHFRPAEKWMILVGGSWDIDLGGKYLGRNVNNPFSLDLYTDLNITAEIQYTLNLWKRNFQLHYGIVSPMVGCMFVPYQNISYYELFVLNNTNHSFHFSSLNSKQGLNQYFNLDIPLKYNTIRLGVARDYLKYSANDMVFEKKDVIFSVGTVINLFRIRGRKNKVPANFINAYE